MSCAALSQKEEQHAAQNSSAAIRTFVTVSCKEPTNAVEKRRLSPPSTPLACVSEKPKMEGPIVDICKREEALSLDDRSANAGTAQEPQLTVVVASGESVAVLVKGR